MATPITFPTTLHRRADEEILAFFDAAPKVTAVLLVNSFARGVGTPASDLDIPLSGERRDRGEGAVITHAPQ